MNEPEESLKGILHDVLVMSFNLLRSLNIEKQSQAAGQTIYIIIFDSFLILDQLLNQPQIATCSTNIWIDLHLPVHLVDSIRVRSYTNINQEKELWVELLAETIDKPVVRVQFSCFFVLDTKE